MAKIQNIQLLKSCMIFDTLSISEQRYIRDVHWFEKLIQRLPHSEARFILKMANFKSFFKEGVTRI